MTTDWHTRIFDYLALAVTAYIALAYNWNANELCWGFWISSLLTGWIVIVSSGLRMLLTNITKKSSSKIKILGCTGSVLLTIFVAFHFSMFHMIHGLLMSVFIRIQPEELFGPNGLINSDLRLVVLQLIYAYWGIILGVLISRRENIFSGDPKKNLEKIYITVVKIHVFILATAFLTPLLVFIDAAIYEKIILLLILALFFWPKKWAIQSHS